MTESTEQAQEVSEQTAAPVEAEAPAEEQPQQPAGPTLEQIQTELRQKNGALRQERAQRQAIQQQMIALQQQLQQIQAQTQQRPVSNAAPPDVNTDPIAFFQYQDRVKEEKLARLEQTLQQQTQQQQLRQEVQRMGAVLEQAGQQFTQDYPDFPQALEHLKATRIKELQEYYPGQMPNAYREAVEFEAAQLVHSAVQTGRDPAEMIYQVSKSRGFGAGMPVQTSPQMKAVQAGAAMAGTLAGGGSDADNGAMTMEKLSKLKGAAFDKAWAKYREQQLGRA